MKLTAVRLLILLCLSALSACEKAKDNADLIPTGPQISEAQLQAASKALWEYGKNTIQTQVDIAEELGSHTKIFLSNPNTETHNQLKSSWRKADIEKNKYYFLGALSKTTPKSLDTLKTLSYHLYAYPIQPGYLDSFGEYRYSGIVHDISLPITAESLINQHGFDDEAAATLGLYALEFMIFGSEDNRPPKDYLAPTQLTKEQQEKGYKLLSETPIPRRRTLLQIQSDVYLADLQQLSTEWNSVKKNSLGRNWQELPAQTKAVFAHAALEKCITALIIRIAEHKKMFDENPKNTTETTLALTYAIQSIQPATGFLPEKHSQIVGARLTDALNALALDSTNDKQENGIQWTPLYNAIKAAADSFIVP